MSRRSSSTTFRCWVRFTETLVGKGGYPSVLGFFSYTAGTPSVAPRLRDELKKVRERHPDRLFVLSVHGLARADSRL